jgi:bacteriocin-like protein
VINVIRELSLDELNEISGGNPNLGGYTACPGGLYVGPCPPGPKTRAT